MNTAELLENLRSELDAGWSNSTGGYTNAVINSLTPDDPDLRCYLEMIATDSDTSWQVRGLATQALREVETDANFLARCGIDTNEWEDLT